MKRADLNTGFYYLCLLLGVGALAYCLIDVFYTHLILFALLAILSPASAWVAPLVLGLIGLLGLGLIGFAIYNLYNVSTKAINRLGPDSVGQSNPEQSRGA